MRSPILVFDIETVADTNSYRKIHGLDPALDEQSIVEIMNHQRLAESGNTFMRHHLHQVVAISLLLADGEKLSLWTLGRNQLAEKEIVRRFFQGIDRFSPTLLSWNGNGFDLPVLHYRALLHQLSAKQYFNIGEEDNSFRYNNYLGRYHWRHIDMMDVLSGFQPRCVAPLDEIAKMCGLPGKLAVDGGKVQDMWLSGEYEAICDYCETDVLNTYGVYLRFALLRGEISQEEYAQDWARLRAFVSEQKAEHFRLFLEAWQEET